MERCPVNCVNMRDPKTKVACEGRDYKLCNFFSNLQKEKVYAKKLKIRRARVKRETETIRVGGLTWEKTVCLRQRA